MTQKRPLVSHFSTARRGRVSAINMIALWSAVAFRAAISRFAAGVPKKRDETHHEFWGADGRIVARSDRRGRGKVASPTLRNCCASLCSRWCAPRG